MRKPKISCYYYKRVGDIYVSDVSFSTDILLSLLDFFPDQKIIFLIDASDCIQTLSAIGKSIGIAGVMPGSHTSSFAAVCHKTELHCLLSRVDIDDFEGIFMAGINNSIAAEALLPSLDHTASSMVKDGISDTAISISFSKNTMVLSLSKERYKAMPIKDKIRTCFGERSTTMPAKQ